jgi:hypothetical protein
MNIEFHTRTAKSAAPAVFSPVEPRFAGRSEQPTMEDFNTACAGLEDDRYADILRLVFNNLTRAQFREFVAALEKIETSEDPAGSPLLCLLQRDRALPFPHRPHGRGGEEGDEHAPGMNWRATLARGFARVREKFSRGSDEYADFEHDDAWQDRWLHSAEDAVWSTDPRVDAMAPRPRAEATH